MTTRIHIFILLVCALLPAWNAHCSLVDAACSLDDGSCNDPVAAGIASSFLPVIVAAAQAEPEPVPDPLPAGTSTLKLWLLAGYGLTQSGTSATRWADQSGNGMDASSPAGTATAPLLKTDAVNGQPALTFDGNLSNYTLGKNFPFATAADGGMTIFAVVRSDHTDAGNTHFVLDFGFHANEAYSIRYSSDGGGTTEAGIGTPSNHGGNHPSFNVLFTPADWVIFTMRVEFGVDQRAYLNGTSAVTTPITLTELTSATVRVNAVRADQLGSPFSIGIQSKVADPNRSFKGDMAEIILFAAALSQSDREAIQCYLSNKYAIMVSHGC